MGAVWVYKYGETTIVVRNKKKTELLINDEVQDSKSGIHLKVELNGKLGTGESVKAVVAGVTDVECMLLINDVLQQPIQITE